MAKGNFNPLKGMGNKLSKALSKHKDEDSTVEDFGSLPAGIEGGVAELYEAKIDEYKSGKLKGKPYFSMRATVLSPTTFIDEHGVKRKIKGLQTKVGPEAMCDTPDNKGDKARRTLDDHVNWVMKQLRTVGVDTTEIEDDDDLMAALEELKETAPQITFRTWKGNSTKQFPNPRVNETWTGVYESDEDEDDDTDDDEEDDRTAKNKKKSKVEDEEEDEYTDDEENDEDEDDADEEEEKPKSKKGKKAKKKAADEDDEDEESDEEESDDDEDDDEVFDDGAVNLDELAEEADGGDKEAKRKLLDLAADKSIRKVKGMTFEDLVAKLKGEDEETEDEDEEEEKPKAKGKGGKKKASADDDEEDDDNEDEEDEEEDNDWEPQEDEVYAYLPEGKDPKTGKAYKKPVQVIVKKVDKRKKTVDLMDNKTKAKFPKVKWLDLQQVD